jgi:hypothetical protein
VGRGVNVAIGPSPNNWTILLRLSPSIPVIHSSLTRLCELLLRRSFCGQRSTAAFLARARVLVVWLQLNVSGFRLVLARTWHGRSDPWLVSYRHPVGYCRSPGKLVSAV